MRVLSLVLLFCFACTPTEDKDDTSPPPGETADSGDSAATDMDGDGFGAAEDCDDSSAEVHPDADETCDGIDNNCDGAIDDDDAGVTGQSTWYADADGDGSGDANAAVLACEQPSNHVADDTDCDDSDAAFHPGAPETDCADPADYNCDGSVGYADADGDGTPACEDCNDDDAALQIATSEVCDEIDNDCDGSVDNDASDATTWYGDADGDGHGGTQFQVVSCSVPAGYVASADDCDDVNAASYPGATEICDLLDNDCDGVVDENVLNTWYADTDGDGYGDAASLVFACQLPPGYSANGNDCDDSDPSIRPGGLELCDGADNDCDGTTDEADALDAPDWYSDSDSDGYGDPASSQAACSAPSGHVADDTDCDPSDSGVHPGAVEVCNGGIDDNCNGFVDDDDPVLDTTTTTDWYTDADADGYGNPGSLVVACVAPGGTVADNTDCADGDSSVNPGAAELCNSGVDDDCDGFADDADPEGASAATWYADADGDGYGDPNVVTVACDQPSQMVSDNTDCDDASAAVHPAATEICNGGVDDDCSTQADDDDAGLDASTTSTWYADADSDGQGDATVTAQACAAPGGYVSNADDCDDTDGTNASCACPEIPSTVSSATAGPHDQHGFCWYLTADGLTCDSVCSDVGGSNLADDAANAWADSCNTPTSDDVSTWFQANDNASGWNNGSATGYHTLGYGYRNTSYYGKCASGTSLNHGTFPGDPNGDATRSLVCPCFVGP